MSNEKNVTFVGRVTRGAVPCAPGPRTHNEEAIARVQKIFDSHEEWQEAYAEIDRRDPNMRSSRV